MAAAGDGNALIITRASHRARPRRSHGMGRYAVASPILRPLAALVAPRQTSVNAHFAPMRRFGVAQTYRRSQGLIALRI